MLRAHCDAVGRDYDAIEKTTMLTLDPLDPHDGVDDLVQRITALRELGLSAAYVYVRNITEPASIIDVLPDASARVR